MKKLTLTTFLLVCFALTNLSQDSSKKTNMVNPKPNSDKSEIVVDLKNIDRLENLFKKQESGWFSKYGTVLVAIVALLGTVVTSVISNRRNRINTELQLEASKSSTTLQLQASRENLTSQLNASEKNLLSQIAASKVQEAEKRNAELQFKLKNELKETVAKFINAATKLNLKLNFIIYSEMEEGRREEAEKAYSQTRISRNEIASYYYSIKVTLDGSAKQKELEKVIDNYMNVTCFKFDFDKTKSDDYEQPIGQLFHKIKSIIHDNYTEPV